jgi:hypothetical protein
MEHTAIFGPFVVMILLTLVVRVYMYSQRIPFIRSSQLKPEQPTPLELARIAPAHVANPSDNLTQDVGRGLLAVDVDGKVACR